MSNLARSKNLKSKYFKKLEKAPIGPGNGHQEELRQKVSSDNKLHAFKTVK